MHSLLPKNSYKFPFPFPFPFPDNAIVASIFASAAILVFVHSSVFHLKMRTRFVCAHSP